MVIAIIGCGWAGRHHARAFAAQGATVCWAVDHALERAEAVAHAYPGALTTNDYNVALADARVDAVAICLPHDLHAPTAIAAAQAGKHVLVEKPLAATLEEADQMIAAAAAAQRYLMVAENVRFDPLYHRVAEMLRAGLIGSPALAKVTRQAYLVQSFLTERPWFLDVKAAAGGIMMSGGIHDVEMLHMVVGEIT